MLNILEKLWIGLKPADARQQHVITNVRYPITALGFAVAFSPALWLALSWLPATLYQSAFHPMGYDSFYHAARILDIAADPSSLYEFDPKIHAPEGSWLTWPWAYDYLLGLTLSVVDLANRAQWLASVPLLILAVNCLTFAMLAMRTVADRWIALTACLAYGLSPLTLNLHGAGMLDHHNIEHWFWMATLLAVMSWRSQPKNMWIAITCGALAGMASAFHNGLFIVQLPLVLYVLSQRYFGGQLDQRACLAMAASLFLTQLLVLLPTSALMQATYHFHTLSWFHLHSAAVSAVAIAFASSRRMGKWRETLIWVAMALIALPLATEFSHGMSFVSASFPQLTAVTETQSPFGLTASTALPPAQATSLYSGLLWLWPVAFTFALWCLIFRPSLRAFALWACLGLVLLATQYRLFYFGLPFLILLPAMQASQVFQKMRARVYLLALLVVCYVPCYWVLSNPPKPGMDARYLTALPVIQALSAACKQEPGIVLATPGWGHVLRYATECSVIANYFIMTPLHAEKIARVNELMQMHSANIGTEPEAIGYVLVSADSSAPLGQELLSHTPQGWSILAEAKGMLDRPVVRAFRLTADTRLD
ncbi:MAG: hypothetical protein DHS20C11_00560 [Lysobacteraceae bacterium]|nr:MAG: hypothetical protein DHS20C11_00560 [Xanthomonadaceae bacterium]